MKEKKEKRNVSMKLTQCFELIKKSTNKFKIILKKKIN